MSAAKSLPEGETEKATKLLERARETYEAIESSRVTSFYRKQFAENLILLKKFSEAKGLLETLAPNDRDAFWHYRWAQTERGLGNLEAARNAVDKAVSLPHDPKFRASFMALRYEIRDQGNDPSALDDLNEAIGLADSDKYRNQLIAQRERHLNRGLEDSKISNANI